MYYNIIALFDLAWQTAVGAGIPQGFLAVIRAGGCTGL